MKLRTRNLRKERTGVNDLRMWRVLEINKVRVLMSNKEKESKKILS